MEEQKILFEMMNDFWKIFKYFTEHREMNEADWEYMTKHAEDLAKKYKGKGNRYWMLYRDIYMAVHRYLEGKYEAKSN